MPSSGSRNLALGTSSDWSAGRTYFTGQNNETSIIYYIYNRGFKIGDRINIRIALKYSDIVAVEGQKAGIALQCEGNVTHWGMGQLDGGGRFWFDKSNGEIEFRGSVVVDEYILQNDFWFWRMRVDYVTSGKIQWKEAKAEISQIATPYSQAPEDLGWSTTILVPTQSNRYLWKFEYVYYSDGSVDITQPTNISIAGVNGTNGQTSHVHFAFADNATGGGFSLTTPKAYMGWYADFNATNSNDPTKYKWSKWKGDQGLPGKPGADGKTSYFHMAYAESADGRTGFSFKESGQQYQGYYTDFTQTNSTDPARYTWMDRRAGVEIGMVNLIKQSTAQKGLRLFPGSQPFEDTNHMLTGWIKIEPNTTYTLTTYEDVDEANMYYSLAWYSTNNADYSGWISRPTGAALATDLKGGRQYASPANAAYAKVSYPTKYSKVKLERGNVSTDYNLAPEDVQADIDSKADQTLTQEQLNALEAKRLQMETEMKALATLQQVSEIETLINNLKKEDLDGRQKIIEIAKAIEERVKDIEPIMEYSQKLKFMDTYITQGNGGMIIGANESTTKVVVTPDRISFQSGGSEVAYISQRMLHIDNGVFTMSLQLGHYITRAHPRNEYVNATYFVK